MSNAPNLISDLRFYSRYIILTCHVPHLTEFVFSQSEFQLHNLEIKLYMLTPKYIELAVHARVVVKQASQRLVSSGPAGLRSLHFNIYFHVYLLSKSICLSIMET